MIILLILDYLLNVANAIGFALCFIGGGGVLFHPLLHMANRDFVDNKWRIPTVKTLLITMIIGLAISAVPDKKLVFGVLAADYMISNTDLQGVPPKAVAALNKYLDTYLEDSGKTND